MYKRECNKKACFAAIEQTVDEVAQLLASLPPTCMGRPEGFHEGLQK
jgi:hypothetical protein